MGQIKYRFHVGDFSRKHESFYNDINVLCLQRRATEVLSSADMFLAAGLIIKKTRRLPGRRVYFPSNSERKCKVYPALGTYDSRWLLQSSGSTIASVDALGYIDEHNFNVVTECAIRPAMWIEWGSEE